MLSKDCEGVLAILWQEEKHQMALFLSVFQDSCSSRSLRALTSHSLKFNAKWDVNGWLWSKKILFPSWNTQTHQMIIFLEHFICSKKNTVTLSNLISYEIGYRIHEDAKIKYKASDPAGVGRWLEKDHLWFEMHVVPLWWRPHSVVTWASSNKVKQVWIYSVSTFPLTIKLAIWKCKKKKKKVGAL